MIELTTLIVFMLVQLCLIAIYIGMKLRLDTITEKNYAHKHE